MGVWSHEPFGNDTANDWAYGLDKVADFSLIEHTMDQVLQVNTEYIDASNAEEAIAAVETLAHALGRGTQSDSYTAKAEAWVKQLNAQPDIALRSKALQVLARVLSKESELNELWAESDEFDEWLSSIQRLRAAIET